MSKYTKAKRKWVDKNVYSFVIENNSDYSSIFHERIELTKDKIKTYCRGSLTNQFEQIKDKIDSGFFNSNFWTARDLARKLNLKFTWTKNI